MKNKFKAIIFDFDGVIADTMHDNFNAWHWVFKQFDIDIEDQDFYMKEGNSRYGIAEYFVNKYSLNTDLIQSLVDQKEKYYKDNNNFKIYHEIPKLLEKLKSNGFKLGLVTGASKDRLSNSMKNNDLLDCFDVIVTADDVKNCKPHPEPYLYAINFLNLEPIDCLVIENAVLGIEAAKKAGCICYAVATTISFEKLNQADKVFENHKNLNLHLIQTNELDKSY